MPLNADLETCVADHLAEFGESVTYTVAGEESGATSTAIVERAPAAIQRDGSGNYEYETAEVLIAPTGVGGTARAPGDTVTFDSKTCEVQSVRAAGGTGLVALTVFRVSPIRDESQESTLGRRR